MYIPLLIKNSFYATGVQIITLLVGIFKSYLLPLLLGVTGFGYWQIYLLYVGFIGLFALGFNDGIYLKYGGYEYDKLPKSKIKGSILIFIAVELFISLLLGCCLFSIVGNDKIKILIYVLINIPLVSLNGSLIYIYQITNRIKEYSIFSLIDKLFFLIALILIFITGNSNYCTIIYLDIFSKVLVLSLMLYSSRDIWKERTETLSNCLIEYKHNIAIGINLMLAIFSASMVMGMAKFIVEKTKSIDDFSLFAFACSSANILLFFVNGIALVIYPTLKRINSSKYRLYYIELSKFVSILFGAGLLIYYPIQFIVNRYLHNYNGIFEYFPLIIVLVFIQAKVQIVINSFYKCLRKEKIMLLVNICNISLFLILCVLFYYLNSSIFSIVLAVLCSFITTAYLSDYYLKRKLNIINCKSTIEEIVLLMAFVTILFLPKNIGFSIFILSYIIYITINYKSLVFITQKFKK